MEIEKLLDDDSQVGEEVDVQGPWFDMVRERIYAVKTAKSKIQVQSLNPLFRHQNIRQVRLKLSCQRPTLGNSRAMCWSGQNFGTFSE